MDGEWESSSSDSSSSYSSPSSSSSSSGGTQRKGFTGFDKLTAPNGTTYEGYWVNDKPHGKGKMTYADGLYYEWTLPR